MSVHGASKYQLYKFSLTTNASGAATSTVGQVFGYIHCIRYVKTDFADGVDFDIVGATTGIVVWNQDNVNSTQTIYPRVATTDETGVASLYAAAGEPVETRILIAGESLTLTVASGGDTKTGTVYLVVG